MNNLVNMDDGSAGSTASIDLTETQKLADLSGGVHLLPCTIKYDGHCSVSHYFRPKSSGIEADGLRVQEACFRGRKLQGATISLPNGYSGYVIGKKSSGRTSSSGVSESNTNNWEAKAKFGCITYWNHDVLPSQEDAVLRSFHWLPVVEALHKPVTAEDLLSLSPGK